MARECDVDLLGEGRGGVDVGGRGNRGAVNDGIGPEFEGQRGDFVEVLCIELYALLDALGSGFCAVVQCDDGMSATRGGFGVGIAE